MEKEPIRIKSLVQHKKDLNLHYVLLTLETMAALTCEFKRGKYNQRVWVEVNQKVKWQGGIVALGDGEGYITLSAARMKTLDVHFGEEVDVSLLPDDTEYGMEMAVEFKAVLDNDSEAFERFLKLKKGMQRYLLYYTIQVKSSEKRLERALLMLNNLKKIPEGKEDFRTILGKD
ncbi:MAG: YdeI/OmpD-associated family protein [Crocinitomicaceae bacterium]